MESSSVELQKQKKNIFKTIFKICCFIILTGLALFYVLKDNVKETFSKLLNIDLFPFLVCLGLVTFMVFLDGVLLTIFSKTYKKDYKFHQGFICSIISACFSAFNKAGGHLVQAITLSKQNVESYHSASIITMNFLMYQLTLTIYSLVFVFVGYQYVKDIPLDLLGNMPIFYISLLGFLIDVLFLLLILLFSLSKKFHSFLIEIGIFFIKLFHIKKDVDTYRKERLLKVTTYRIEFKRLLHHKKLVISTFLVGCVRQIITNSIPFFTLWCMDVDVMKIGYFPLLCGSSYLNLITTFIPTGAPEVGFQSIFSYFITTNLGISDTSFLSSSNLLWRFLTFYLPIIVGGIVFFFYKGPDKKKIKIDNDLTMYDLEVANYNATIIVGKDNSKEELPITQEDIEKSIKKIKRQFSKMKNKKETKHYDTSITLSIQKEELAQVMEEVNRIEEEKNKNQKEILDETDKEIERINKHRIIKNEKKRKKKLEKEEKMLEKLQPIDTHITYDEKYGINLGNSAFIVSDSYTTSDASEVDNSLDDEKKEE